MMAFKIGDRVRVRQDPPSPYAGKVGVVSGVKRDAHGTALQYQVRLDSAPSIPGSVAYIPFAPNELEPEAPAPP
jgi:hypothetical protein